MFPLMCIFVRTMPKFMFMFMFMFIFMQTISQLSFRSFHFRNIFRKFAYRFLSHLHFFDLIMVDLQIKVS